MVAIQQDITVEAYATFRFPPVICYAEDADTGQLVIRDLAGWTGTMQIRPDADSDTVLATADVAIDVDTGIVTATIDDTITATYTWRTGVYDLVITDGIETDRLAEGDARLRRGVTRA